MPVIFRYQGFRFFFYSHEGIPLEPPHVHVRKDNREAKIWLTPVASVAWNKRFDPKTLRKLLLITEEHREEFENEWNIYFSGTY